MANQARVHASCRRAILRGSLAALGAFGFAGVAAGEAVGATTCAFDSGTHVLTVDGTPEGGSYVSVEGANITVGHIFQSGGSGTVSCSGSQPTTANTDAILATLPAGGDHTFLVIDPDEFTPGFTSEMIGASEIEITATLGDGSDTFEVSDFEGLADDRWTLGQAGLEWNPLEVLPDTDVIVNGADGYEIHPRGGENAFTGQGSAVAGAPVTGPIAYGPGGTGAADVDRATGGEGPDRFEGNVGNDILKGAGDDDVLIGDAGRDKLIGGEDDDILRAKDGKRDLRLSCGPGDNALEKAARDRAKDPEPISC